MFLYLFLCKVLGSLPAFSKLGAIEWCWKELVGKINTDLKVVSLFPALGPKSISSLARQKFKLFIIMVQLPLQWIIDFTEF